jgi:hypothetical protein
MFRRSLGWLTMLAVVWPLTLSAQRGVERERFTFIGNSLEIEVLADVPGELRLVHGQLGEIVVSARAAEGIAGFGLAGGDRGKLRLTSVGAERVEYLVVIPEGIQVSVRLPTQSVAQTLGTLQKTAVYTWDPAGL